MARSLACCHFRSIWGLYRGDSACGRAELVPLFVPLEGPVAWFRCRRSNLRT